MKVENFYRALHTQGGIRLKAHKQIHFGTLDIKEKDYKQILFLKIKYTRFHQNFTTPNL